MGKWLGEKGIQYILCLCDSNSRGTASHPDKGNARAASPLARSSIPQTATRSVTRVDVRIAGSRLPIAVSVIVATTGTRIVAPAEGDADPDTKVRTSPEASTVVIALAGVEPARIVTASGTVVSAAVAAARVRGGIAAPAVRIAAARVGGGIAAPAVGIAAARVGGGIAAPTARVATAGVGRGRIAASTAAREGTAGRTAARVPTSSPAAALGQCGSRAKQHQDRAKSKRRHRGFER